jgi:hypothetical protein
MIAEAQAADNAAKRAAARAKICGAVLPYGERRENVQKMAHVSYEEAYPGIEILPRSRNWWAWLKGSSPECVHMGEPCDWIATLVPDTLYLRGKKSARREPVRPELTMCLSCLSDAAGAQMEQYPGRVVAFEPDPELFTQYFFVAPRDFEAVGLRPEVSEAIGKRLAQDLGACEECGCEARWLWFSRSNLESLDEVDKIAEAPGHPLCAKHGADRVFQAFDKMHQANVYYMNLPYDEAGAYVWI